MRWLLTMPRWPAVAQVGGLRAADVVAACLLLALWVAGLGGAPLFDVDEGAFAEASREMWATGDWGHTSLNGADRFDKPIGVYWLQATSLALLGASEAAVRLPSALCAWGWGLAVAGFAAARWGRSTGWLAAAILSTGLGPVLIGRAATADALLNLLLALTLMDLWRALTPETSGPDAAQRAWRRAGLWIGLGLLAKGPVALVVPGGALLSWAALGGRPAWQQLGRRLSDPWAWGLLLCTSLPWYVYAVWRHGQAFVDGFLLRHNFERFVSTLEGHGGHPLYHVVVLPLLLLPWTPLLLPLLSRPRATAADGAIRLPLVWCAFVLAFFSLASTKLPHYALYGITPLVLLAARQAGRDGASRGLLLAVGALAGISVLLGAASVPVAQAWADTEAAGPHWRERLQSAWVEPGPASGLASLWLLGMTALAGLAWHRADLRLPAMVGLAAGSALWWVMVVVPFWGQHLQSPVRELAQEAHVRGLPLVQWQLHQPSAGFYRQQPAPRRAPQVGEAALLRSDRLAAASAEAGRPLVVLRRAPGFVLVQIGPP